MKIRTMRRLKLARADALHPREWLGLRARATRAAANAAVNLGRQTERQTKVSAAKLNI
jgi:hypothetical protein